MIQCSCLTRNTYTLATPWQTLEGGATIQAPLPAVTPTIALIPPPVTSPNVTTSLVPAPPIPSSMITPTQDGWCGAIHNDTTCAGWPLGQCCSEYGACGNGVDWCNTGCQSEFGICALVAPNSPPSLSTVQIVPSSPAAILPLASSPAVAIPSPSVSAVPVCTPLVTFFDDGNYAGMAYAACGTFGVCQDLPQDFQSTASSLTWTDANSCSLYDGAGCTGDTISYYNGDDEESFFTDFNDATVSYVCYSTYP
jgi:hypothetical protein